jgi:hypothetical protein
MIKFLSKVAGVFCNVMDTIAFATIMISHPQFKFY